MDLAADFAFADESGEFTRQAPLLRYVAAINPDATRLQFVEAAVALGYHPKTAEIQFRQSRRESMELDRDSYTLADDGRMIERT